MALLELYLPVNGLFDLEASWSAEAIDSTNQYSTIWLEPPYGSAASVSIPSLFTNDTLATLEGDFWPPAGQSEDFGGFYPLSDATAQIWGYFDNSGWNVSGIQSDLSFFVLSQNTNISFFDFLAELLWDDDVLTSYYTSEGVGVKLSGFSGNDTIYGNIGDDWLEGDADNDTLFGGGGNDTIDGGDGNDVLIGGEGNDSLDGGAGYDTASYAYSSVGLSFIHNGNSDFTGLNAYFVSEQKSFQIGSNDLNVTTVEAFIGTNFDDLYVGSHTSGFFQGLDGNDNISGNGELSGDAGNDTLWGYEGNNSLSGGSGSDIIYDMQGNDTIDGGDDNDTISSFSGNFYNDIDKIMGGDGDDTITRGGLHFGNETTDGGTGNDTISGERLNLAYGGDGDDYFSFSSADTIYGDAGNDTFLAQGVFQNLYGGEGTDTLIVTGLGSRPLGNVTSIENLQAVSVYAYASTLASFSKIFAPSISGPDIPVELHLVASGHDTVLDLSGRMNGVGFGRAWLRGSDDSELITFSSKDDIAFGWWGNDTLNGGDGADQLYGAEDFYEFFGNDLLNGQLGNDYISGLGGNDTINGGEGNDYLDGGRGNDSINGGLGNETIYGGIGNDSIDGGIGNDNVEGGIGNDTITGGTGNDIIDGGTGRDRMSGGAGNDFYTVDDAGDLIIELSGEGTDAINTALASLVLVANVERLNYTGVGNFVGIGNSGNNRFNGGAGADRFVDVLGGNDTVSGGNGSDSMDFRSSTTGAVLNFTTNVHDGAAAGDLYASIEKYSGSNTANDSMTGGGAGRFIFTGGGGNDTLVGAGNIDNLQGQAGDDSISGLAGIDSLDGGAGNDTMTGGSGKDYFIYAAAGFGTDIITDYEDGLDKLKVHSSIANNIAAFNITGSGTTSVVLTQVSAPANTITLQSASAINMTAADFVFY